MTGHTRRRRLFACLAVTVALLLSSTTLGAADTASARSPSVVTAADPGGRAALSRAEAQRVSGTQVQKVRVKWNGRRKKQRFEKSAVIPGIGALDLICRPNKQMVRLYTSTPTRETQMWLQKYETKNGNPVVSVKTPRVYRYAHAEDDGRGGTGFYAHEALNQEPGVENRSQDGYLFGIISQRPGRHQSGAALDPLLPVTTFELTWFWNGFDHARAYQSCTIKAKLTTRFPETQRTSLTWRGDLDLAPTEITSRVPGVGELRMTCPHGMDEAPSIAIAPYSSSSSLFVQDVQGEGSVEHQRVETAVAYDAESALLGPYPLPENGTLRISARNGSSERWLMVSSYFVRNDALGPQRNVCEVAAGSYRR